MPDQKRYRENLDWIHGLGRFGSRPGLERITRLLAALGNPHRRLRFVHIGGTNGKGSTAAMLASILRAAGYRVGLYTSPYLLSFTNRMTVNGADIDRQDLNDLVETVRPLVEKIAGEPDMGPMTEFEVVTTLALAYFARREAELVVFEVGLGGRLDATNVITPLLSIITNVSLEHTQVLGDTVEAIAGEKAGIIKNNVPVLTAARDRKVLGVIRSRALEKNAPFYRLFGPDGSGEEESVARPSFSRQAVSAEGQYFKYRGFENDLDRLFIPLRGIYQLWNGATALAALELLSQTGFPVDEEAIRRGFSETVWPGRLEVMSRRPLLVMDGAHNPEAMKELARAIPEYFSYRNLILVVGIMADKDAAAILRSIMPLAHAAVFTRPEYARAASPGDLAALARDQLGFDQQKSVVAAEIGSALDKAVNMAGPDDLVIVTGSLYTVSDARAYWAKRQSRPKDRILKNV